jgi:HEAT repeat protein
MAMSDISKLLNFIQSNNTSDDVLCETARALLVIDDQRATKPIMERIIQKKDSPWVRKELFTALGGISQSTENLKTQVIDLLLSTLTSAEEANEVRETVASILGILGVTKAFEPLFHMLQTAIDEKNYSQIFACIDALSRIKDIRAIKLLIQILDADIPMVKVFAAEALSRFGPSAKESLPSLTKLAELGNQAERKMALEAISIIEGDTE